MIRGSCNLLGAGKDFSVYIHSSDEARHYRCSGQMSVGVVSLLHMLLTEEGRPEVVALTLKLGVV